MIIRAPRLKRRWLVNRPICDLFSCERVKTAESRAFANAVAIASNGDRRHNSATLGGMRSPGS